MANRKKQKPMKRITVIVDPDDYATFDKMARHTLPNFPVFKEFEGASYADRYNILCRKLVQEQLYTTASVIISPRSAVDTGDYLELSDMTGLKTFVTELAGHVAAEAARAGGNT